MATFTLDYSTLGGPLIFENVILAHLGSDDFRFI